MPLGNPIQNQRTRAKLNLSFKDDTEHSKLEKTTGEKANNHTSSTLEKEKKKKRKKKQ